LVDDVVRVLRVADQQLADEAAAAELAAHGLEVDAASTSPVRLARRAPVRRAVVVALAAGPNRGAAARTRATGLPVDKAGLAAVLQRRAHQPRRLAQRALELLVVDRFQPQPRREARAPKRLSLPEVPDPRDEALVEEPLPELPCAVLAGQVRHDRVEIGRVVEDVRTEAAAPTPGPIRELQDRPVP